MSGYPPHPYGYAPPPPGMTPGYSPYSQQTTHHPYPPQPSQQQQQYHQQQQYQQHSQYQAPPLPASAPPVSAPVSAPPPPSSSSPPPVSSPAPYIGGMIALISKAGLRYEGILYTIDSKAATVALKDGHSAIRCIRCYGSENRLPPDQFVPPSSQVYGFIIFSGKDIQDLRVMEQVKTTQQQQAANTFRDPAIISSTTTPAPTPAPAPTSTPAAVPSLPVQPAVTPAPAPAPAPVVAPAKLQAEPVKQNESAALLKPQTLLDRRDHEDATSKHEHQMAAGHADANLGDTTTALSSASLQERPSSSDSRSSQRGRGGQRQRAERGREGGQKDYQLRTQQQQQQPPHSNSPTNQPSPKPRYTVSILSSSQPIDFSDSQHPPPAAHHHHSNHHPHHTPQHDRRQYQQQQPQQRQPTNPASQPVQNAEILKSEFDFASSNARFNKDEYVHRIVGQQTEEKKEEHNHATTARAATATATGAEPASTTTGNVPVEAPSYQLPAADDSTSSATSHVDAHPLITPKYNKAKSFFDDLSNDKTSGAGGRGQRPNRQLDKETFGELATQQSRHHHHGYQGGGYRRGGGGAGRWDGQSFNQGGPRGRGGRGGSSFYNNSNQ